MAAPSLAQSVVVERNAVVAGAPRWLQLSAGSWLWSTVSTNAFLFDTIDEAEMIARTVAGVGVPALALQDWVAR